MENASEYRERTEIEPKNRMVTLMQLLSLEGIFNICGVTLHYVNRMIRPINTV